MAQQVRLDEDTETVVANEMERIREKEHTKLSTTQAVNRMLREWQATAEATEKKTGRR